MKILFLSAANSIHTVRWVNGLAELGYDILLVSLKNHAATADSILKRVKVIYLPFGGKKGYYLNAPFLGKVYREHQVDVINVHYASGYGTLARAAKLPDIFLSVWGSDVYDFPNESWIKKHIIRKNLEYARIIGSTSRNMVKQTQKLLRKKRSIKVIPFGVDLNQFYPQPDKDSDKTVFGIVKTLSSKYGIDTVLKAFAIFHSRLSEGDKEKVSLEIYGEGELLYELKVLAGKLGIGNRVMFKGYVPNQEIPGKLNKIDIFVLGSKMDSESFGVSAVEAMACGLPVIATDVAGFREVIENGVTGWLVPVGDIKGMSDYMMKLYLNKELRAEMGRNGRLRVKKLYNWNQCLNSMDKIYKDLSERKR